MMDSVAIIGPGRIGLTLAAALAESRQIRAVTVYGRHPEAPAHPIFTEGDARYVFGLEPLERDTSAVLLAVPDATVPEMAFALAGHGAPPDGCVAFHCSGALPTDVLEPLHHQGYSVGSFHPLLAVTNPTLDVGQLPGSWVAVTGAPETVAVARRLSNAMGMRLLSVPAGRRPQYHAAVVMASTLMLPLLGRSAKLMERAGISGEDALAALISLVRSTLDSIEIGGVPDSIRGPIARGDVETVALHLRALDFEDRRLYATLGLEVLRLSEGVLDPEAGGELAGLFAKYVELETTETGH